MGLDVVTEDSLSMTVSTMVEHLQNTFETRKINWATRKLFILEINEENKKFYRYLFYGADTVCIIDVSRINSSEDYFCYLKQTPGGLASAMCQLRL